MTFEEMAASLGLASCPDRLRALFPVTDLSDTALCSKEMLRETEKELGLFGELFDEVLAGAEALSSSPRHLAYANLAVAYLREASPAEVRALPCPESDKTPAGDLLMLFILLSRLPSCRLCYRSRGFSEEDIRRFMEAFPTCLRLVKSATGRAGIDRIYYHWLTLYTEAEIFDHGSFNFQISHLNLPFLFLINKETGEYAVLPTEGRFHREGQLLGSAGYEDEEGSFEADFSETDTCFSGHTSGKNGFVSPHPSTFPKSQWDCVLRKGDPIVSVHIPRKTDLSAEAVRRSYEGGLLLARKHYPEHGASYLYCGSWIIDSRLHALLGDDSRIVGFGDTFHRFPLRSGGRDGMMFFFPGHTGTDEELPETTSLQRKIKALYLGGGHTYASAGFVTDIHL